MRTIIIDAIEANGSEWSSTETIEGTDLQMTELFDGMAMVRAERGTQYIISEVMPSGKCVTLIDSNVESEYL